MPSKLPEFLVIKDTREQQGWFWTEEEKKPGKCRVLGTVEQGLDAGDYSIVGLDQYIRIERKRSFQEIMMNLTNKENKERFERELEKLVPIKEKYLIIESVLHQDILGLSIPQQRQGPPIKRIIELLMDYEHDYGIRVKFVGDCGQWYARALFEKAARRYL